MIHKFGPLSDEFLQKKETYFKNYKYTVLQSDKFRFDKMSETPTSGDQIYYWLEALRDFEMQGLDLHNNEFNP